MRQRTAFIMFDGQKSVERVLASGAALGLTQDDVDHMVAQGFLGDGSGRGAKGRRRSHQAAAAIRRWPNRQSPHSPGPLSGSPAHGRKLTASLGLRGFRLNLAVEGAPAMTNWLALPPKIKEAVGAQACAELERTLTQ